MVTMYKLKPKAKVSGVSSEPDLYHQTCCDDDVSLCGMDVSNTPFSDGVGEQNCVVCQNMLECDTPCRSDCDF